MMQRLLVSLLLLAAVAQARSMRVVDFHTRLEVHADGLVEVTERIQVEFIGRWNGIYRYIPYRYVYPGGLRGDIRLRLHSVEDEDGTPYEIVDESREGGHLFLKIRVRRAENAVRTVVLRYTAQNVLRTWHEQDELYWNVTGNGWDVPIDRASAEVVLPETVPADAIRTAAYRGRYGDTGGGVAIDGLRFATESYLPPHHGLTIVVGFPVGLVEHPTRAQRIGWAVAANWALGLPPLALLAWLLLWWFRGRDALAGATIVPEFEAPFDLRPTEVGVLADDRMHDHDLSAALIDLAARGVIAIEEKDGDYELSEAKGWRGTDLRPFEEELLSSIFRLGRKDVRLGSLKYAFAAKRERVRDRLLDDLVRRKFFHGRPDVVRGTWTGITIVALIALFFAGFLHQSGLYYLVFAVCGVLMWLLARAMPQRTRKGLEALRRIKGMEEYLATAEKERMKELPRDRFEKLLPYAMALGMHEAWVKAFEALYQGAPAWLPAGAGLSHGVGNFLSTSCSSFNYVPRTAMSSSGSSGWSGGSGFGGGGGFSGGGFGGGGGGGW